MEIFQLHLITLSSDLDGSLVTCNGFFGIFGEKEMQRVECFDLVK
jgi:hypothetical protein